jgi:hypothetical protein
VWHVLTNDWEKFTFPQRSAASASGAVFLSNTSVPVSVHESTLQGSVLRDTVTVIYLSMDLQSLWILAAFSVSWSFTQSVGHLGVGISPSQGRYLHTEQYKHRINAYRHPCLEWDSNPRSQCLSRWRRFMPETTRPLWSAVTVIIHKKDEICNACACDSYSL